MNNNNIIIAYLIIITYIYIYIYIYIYLIEQLTLNRITRVINSNQSYTTSNQLCNLAFTVQLS